MDPDCGALGRYTVNLSGLSFRGPWGVTAEERATGCSIKVDVTVLTEGDGPETDNVDDTVDYARLAGLVEECVFEGGNLLEHLAGRITERIMQAFSSVESVTVTVYKAPAPLPQVHDHASVTMSCSRALAKSAARDNPEPKP